MAEAFAFLGETMDPSRKSFMSLQRVKLGISKSGIVNMICFTLDLKKPFKDKLNLEMLD